jgi:hypothetical protein
MSKTVEELAEEYCASFYEKDAFLAGYQAAQERAHAALEEAEVEIDRLQTKLSDAGILTTDHIVDASKMVDVSSSVPLNNWISVKDRLPEFCEDVLVRGECGIIDQGHRIKWDHCDEWVWRAGNYSGYAEEVTHWKPLPKPPEE